MKSLSQHIQEGLSQASNESLIDNVVGDFKEKKQKGIAEEAPEKEEKEEVSENKDVNEDLEKEKPAE